MYKQAIVNNLIKKALFSKEELIGAGLGAGAGIAATRGVGLGRTAPLARGVSSAALGAGAGYALANDLKLDDKNKRIIAALGGGINGLLNAYAGYKDSKEDDAGPSMGDSSSFAAEVTPLINLLAGAYFGHRTGSVAKYYNSIANDPKIKFMY